MKMKNLCIIFGLAMVITPRILIAGGDLQYWSRYVFQLFNERKISGILYSDTRLYENISLIGYYEFSPQLQYKLHAHLDIQTNFTYVKARVSEGEYIRHYRVESEINPHFAIGHGPAIYFRNRLEFRNIEDNGWKNTRFRGRIQIILPFNQSGFFRSIMTNTEFFYDFAARKHLEQWTTPLGINFNITKHIEGQLFYMIQNFRKESWFSNHIIGSMITVKF